MPIQVKPIVGHRVGFDDTLRFAVSGFKRRLGADGDGRRPAVRRVGGEARANRSEIQRLRDARSRRDAAYFWDGVRSACGVRGIVVRFAKVDQPAGVHAIHRQVSVDGCVKVRCREADVAATLLTVDDGAFDAVRRTEDGVRILDASLGQQVADVRRTPYSRLLGLMAFAPCA